MPPVDLYSGASGMGQGLAQVWNFNPNQQLGFQEDILARQLALEKERVAAARKREALERDAINRFRAQTFDIANVVPGQMEAANAERNALIAEQQRILETPEGREAVIRMNFGNPTEQDMGILNPFQARAQRWTQQRQQAENASAQYEEYRKALERGDVLANPNAELYGQGDRRFTLGGYGNAGLNVDEQEIFESLTTRLKTIAPQYATAWANADSEGRRSIQQATLPQRQALVAEYLNDPRAQDEIVQSAILAGVLPRGSRSLTPEARAKMEQLYLQKLDLHLEEATQTMGAGARAEAAARGQQRAEAVVLLDEQDVVPDAQYSPHPGIFVPMAVGAGDVRRSGYTSFASAGPQDPRLRRSLMGFDLTRNAFDASTGRQFSGDRSQQAYPGELRVIPYVTDAQGRRTLVSRAENPEAFETGMYNGRPIKFDLLQEVQVAEGEIRTRQERDRGGEIITIDQPERVRSVVVQPQFLQGAYTPETVRQLEERRDALNRQYDQLRGGSRTAAPAPQPNTQTRQQPNTRSSWSTRASGIL